MRIFSPKMKILRIILISLIIVHAVLSCFGCVQKVEQNYIISDSVTVFTYTEGLLPEMAILFAVIRVVLLFGTQGIVHVMLVAMSLFVAVCSSAEQWINSLFEGIGGGLIQVDSSYTSLGVAVILLSWLITLVHAFLLGWMYWPKEGLTQKAKQKCKWLLAAGIVVLILLIIFRDPIADFIKWII